MVHRPMVKQSQMFNKEPPYLIESQNLIYRDMDGTLLTQKIFRSALPTKSTPWIWITLKIALSNLTSWCISPFSALYSMCCPLPPVNTKPNKCVWYLERAQARLVESEFLGGDFQCPLFIPVFRNFEPIFIALDLYCPRVAYFSKNFEFGIFVCCQDFQTQYLHRNDQHSELNHFGVSARLALLNQTELIM